MVTFSNATLLIERIFTGWLSIDADVISTLKDIYVITPR
jgi:hypothetical protein